MSLHPNVLAQARAVKLTPTLLVAFPDWQGGTYWTTNPVPVTFGIQTYTSRKLGLPAVAAGTTGLFKPIDLTIDNTDKLLQRMVQAENPTGQTVHVHRAYLDDLTDLEPMLLNWQVVSPTVTPAEATLSISFFGSLARKKIPARILSRACPWVFKGTACGYAGAEIWCDFTWERCTTLGRTTRFGGIPIVPARRY